MHKWNRNTHNWVDTDVWKQRDYYQTVEDDPNNPNAPENKVAV